MKTVFGILVVSFSLFSCDVTPVQQLFEFIQRADVLDIPVGDSTTTEFDGAKYQLVSQFLKSCDCIVDTRGEVCDTLSLFSGDEPFEVEHVMGELAIAETADSAPVLQSGSINNDKTFSLGFVVPVNNNDTGEVVGEGLVLMQGTIDDEKMLFTARFHIMAAMEGREADCEFVADYVFVRVEDDDM